MRASVNFKLLTANRNPSTELVRVPGTTVDADSVSSGLFLNSNGRTPEVPFSNREERGASSRGEVTAAYFRHCVGSGVQELWKAAMTLKTRVRFVRRPEAGLDPPRPRWLPLVQQ